MVQIDIEYRGELRCEATHGPSGSLLATDAPVDNQGRGESYSPTDLLATSLGTCMLTIMGIRARDLGVKLDGTTVRVAKHMVADPQRRVGRLEVSIRLPAVDAAHQPALEEAAHRCPVANSIDPRIEVEVRFGWGEQVVEAG
ncbi:MAG: OsmC family protein [Planctomycetota bacterium]